MKKAFLFLLVIAGWCCPGAAQTMLFDNDWRFYKGGALSAENPLFDDTSWRPLDLPHDWSIEDLPGTRSPFRADAISSVGGGFTTGGTGWYRKKFTIDETDGGKLFQLQFDGVYMNSEVWVNGTRVGEHPYGYTGFSFDITSAVKPGDNVVAVKVRNEGETSRWYAGSGIYRHVWLRKSEPVHIATWGTNVAMALVTSEVASVEIRVKIDNSSNTNSEIRVISEIYDSKNERITQNGYNHEVSSKEPYEFAFTATIYKPKLWSVDKPVLYTLVTRLIQGDSVIDESITKFGIRSISFDAVNGFLLNGKPLKLKGGCVHQDNGPLGVKAYDRAEERRIQILKASGYNALRCSHNPPSPAFLDACDKLGMLVIDEAFDIWQDGKNAYDYHLYFDKWWKRDVESMILRDRNHPSIILWSIGNEIPSMEEPAVVETAKMLSGYIRTLDTTRAITAAVNGLSDKKDPFFSAVDVGGYNYAAGGDHNQKSIYELDHNRLPKRIMFGSESYALEAFGAWMGVVDHPWVIGDFVWTAFDYIGEASIGWRGYWQEQNFYPWNLAYCGDIDICGWKRPQSYYRDALWKENQISVFVKPLEPSFELNPKRESWSKWHWHDVLADWTWPGAEGKLMDITIYSSCEQVELFLNGKSLGKKPTGRNTEFIATYQLNYEAGELKAVGYKGKKIVSESILRTAANPIAIRLSADNNAIRADGQDLSYITVELTDKPGVRNPKADNDLKFEIDGPGTIVAVGNANPVSTESYQLLQRKAWQGRALVIVKAGKTPGTIRLNVTATGLSPASITIHTK